MKHVLFNIVQKTEPIGWMDKYTGKQVGKQMIMDRYGCTDIWMTDNKLIVDDRQITMKDMPLQKIEVLYLTYDGQSPIGEMG